MEASTDDELVARARAQDANAFGVLMHRHYGACLRYAYRMLNDRADAEDAVQEAFIRVYRALHRYDARDRFRPWLFTILRNRCNSAIARRGWRLERLRRWWHPETRVATNGGGEGSDIQRALAAIPPLLREAFLLKHAEEMSYPEMMRVTGASESALKMRVKRACEALESLLKEP